MASAKSNGKAKKEEVKKEIEQPKPDLGTTTVVPSSTGGWIVSHSGTDGSWYQSIQYTNPLEENS